jgi:hypothetical protein
MATTSDGFRQLFNGKDLSGWQTHPQQHGNWHVENGNLVGSGPSAVSHLYTVRDDYGDFHLRVEARVNDVGNSGVCFCSSFGPSLPSSEPKYPRAYEAQIYSKPGDKNFTGSLFAGTEPVVSVKRPVTGPFEWFTLEIIARGNHVIVMVNGLTTVDHMELLSRGRIALQQLGPETIVEFRKIEIQELNQGTSHIEATAGSRSFRAVFVDDFNDPKSGWSDEPEERKKSNAADHHGYQEGFYRFDANMGGGAWWFYPCPKRPRSEFACVVVGRVYGDRPTSRGSMGIHVLSGDHGFQVRIDNLGQLFVEPSNATVDKDPNAPRVGPITHPAIRADGKNFNTIELQVDNRQAQVMVNGAAVCRPVTFDWDPKSPVVLLGVFCDSPGIRAEFDRIEIKERQ